MKTLGDVIPELESLLAWARAHQGLPSPTKVEVLWHEYQESKVAASAFIRSLPKVEKDSNGPTMWIKHQHSPVVELTMFLDRAAICERVVVGTREVPEKTTPAHTEEIVEWKCGSILAPAEHATTRQEENASVGEGINNGAIQP